MQTNARSQLKMPMSKGRILHVTVRPDLLKGLRKQYGEQSPIADIREKRVFMLRDAVMKKETNIDPESILGKGWILEENQLNDPFMGENDPYAHGSDLRFSLVVINPYNGMCHDFGDQSLIISPSTGKVALISQEVDHNSDHGNRDKEWQMILL